MQEQPQPQPVDAISRRSLLCAAAAGALTLALPRGARAPAAGARRAVRPFAAKLPIPQVLTGADLTIPMREAEVAILPGRKTRMWTYAGSFPGPTIRRPAGETTRVRFLHQLPQQAGELTVHLHGGHNRCTEDGQPGGLTSAQPQSLYCDISPGLSEAESGNDLLIAPGGQRTYTYEQVEDGGPERASFQWYHDHRLDRTGRNVWRGLAGMWIVDDDVDASLPLPRGSRDIPLMLADRSFDAYNQLRDPFAEQRRPPRDGVTGERVLVNGAVLPHHNVRPQRYRLRVLNASHFRSYELRLSGNLPMVQIATDSGLMPRPVRRSRVLLGPGERAELIVDFAVARGEHVRLLSGRRRHGPGALGSVSYAGPLMEFRVGTRREPDRTAVPRALRPLPAWVAEAARKPSHAWRFTVGSGLRPRWLVNGRAFDPAYADVTAALGETVTWELHNQTGVAHLIHLHHTDWYMLSRNGRRPPPWEACLKDTFLLDPRERVVIAGRMSDYTGKYVMHCHMLDHEDHGLMSQFEVVA
ncbi:MAG TPA: multicopper oxidase family protein [Solirubrobacteraceae bacterium]|nr:multicopper oxidase family protein [Solirubrobacteraceae bacterium]